MSWIKATERGEGWLYTEYEESAYGLISVVAEWWGAEPATLDKAGAAYVEGGEAYDEEVVNFPDHGYVAGYSYACGYYD